MNKILFRQNIIAPLNNEFNVVIYLNGKLAKKHRIAISSQYLGMAYTHRKVKKIVLIWQKNRYSTLQTLFHEIGHIVLHSRGTYFRGSQALQEVEAEMVAKEACQLLNVPYDPNFKISNKNYISEYIKEIRASEAPRIQLINECANRIYETLKNIREL